MDTKPMNKNYKKKFRLWAETDVETLKRLFEIQ